MKYVSMRNGYVSLKNSITKDEVVNLLNEPDTPHPLPQPIKTNSSVGVIREPDPLVRGGDLISSLQKTLPRTNEKILSFLHDKFL